MKSRMGRDAKKISQLFAQSTTKRIHLEDIPQRRFKYLNIYYINYVFLYVGKPVIVGLAIRVT